MQKLTSSELKALVLSSFEAEKTNNVIKNLSLIADDFEFTDMVVKEDGTPFITVAGNEVRDLMDRAFRIKGRQFIFKSLIADEDEQKVMVEFIESYSDPQTGKEYRTPQIAVIKIEDGLINRTRHYMDPRMSNLHLSADEVEQVFEK